jgi:MYXO-CTERM domain-containing protein
LRFDNGSALAGAWTGPTLSVWNWIGGFYNSFAPFNGTLGEVSATPVPEPSGAFVATGLLGLIGWRERRRAQQQRRAARGGSSRP